ncbi:MAG: hypothetical protein IPG99_15985 [Ignavibacteria bacterium]|nr:hypothetical protein [Ignavibacteria bacterium]
MGTQIKLDNEGNVFVAGSATEATTNEDFVLIKYKSDGQREWVRTYDILNHTEQIVDRKLIIREFNNFSPAMKFRENTKC